jgi:type IV pilus assembly protein PilA
LIPFYYKWIGIEGRAMGGIRYLGNRGFTIVELMVTVAIVGILTGVAVPNYLKYVAKSRQTEAKLFLSALYVGQQSYSTEFLSYTACLPQTGFYPGAGVSNYIGTQYPYYGGGFSFAAATSVNCGNPAHACNLFGDGPGPGQPPSTTCTGAGGGGPVGALASGQEPPNSYSNQFPAAMVANAALGWPNNSQFSVSSFSTAGTAQKFTAAAVGNISYNATALDVWTIDQNKTLVNLQSGI